MLTNEHSVSFMPTTCFCFLPGIMKISLWLRLILCFATAFFVVGKQHAQNQRTKKAVILRAFNKPLLSNKELKIVVQYIEPISWDSHIELLPNKFGKIPGCVCCFPWIVLVRAKNNIYNVLYGPYLDYCHLVSEKASHRSFQS